jgi:hypothetical protein
MISTAIAAARLAAGALLLVIARPVVAQAPADGGLRFLIEGALEMGGDRLVRLDFTDGTSQELSAGQGGTIGAGFQWRPAAVPRFSAAATVGFKFVSNASENADIGITRVPLKLSGRWAVAPDWAIGAGLVRHGTVRINGDGFFDDETLTSSSGLQLEVAWRAVALTYTGLTYTDATGKAFDAGSIGLGFRWVARDGAAAKR